MKKFITVLSFVVVSALCIVFLSSFIPQDENKTVLEDGTIVVNTTKLGAKIYGFRDTTPIKVYVKDGKISKIEAMENYETPQYFEIVTSSGLLEKWNGKTLKQASEMEVDAVSGATYSSNAIIENVKAAVNYLLQ